MINILSSQIANRFHVISIHRARKFQAQPEEHHELLELLEMLQFAFLPHYHQQAR